MQALGRVRHRHEPAAGTKHPRQLGEATVEVGDVVEHPGGERAVERRVLEWKVLHVSDACVDAAAPRQLDHPLGLVDRDHLGAELVL